MIEQFRIFVRDILSDVINVLNDLLLGISDSIDLSQIRNEINNVDKDYLFIF